MQYCYLWLCNKRIRLACFYMYMCMKLFSMCVHMYVAVRALVKNPPEGGTFLGSPVEYFSVLESEIPDHRPHVLVITGFPSLPTVDVAMRHYLKTVVHRDIVSIDVLGEEMLVKFANAQGSQCL